MIKNRNNSIKEDARLLLKKFMKEEDLDGEYVKVLISCEIACDGLNRHNLTVQF